MAHVAPWAIRGVTGVIDKSRAYRQEDATGTSPTAVMRTLWALHRRMEEGALLSIGAPRTLTRQQGRAG